MIRAKLYNVDHGYGLHSGTFRVYTTEDLTDGEVLSLLDDWEDAILIAKDAMLTSLHALGYAVAKIMEVYVRERKAALVDLTDEELQDVIKHVDLTRELNLAIHEWTHVPNEGGLTEDEDLTRELNLAIHEWTHVPNEGGLTEDRDRVLSIVRYRIVDEHLERQFKREHGGPEIPPMAHALGIDTSEYNEALAVWAEARESHGPLRRLGLRTLHTMHILENVEDGSLQGETVLFMDDET